MAQDFEVKEVIHQDSQHKVVSVVNILDRIPYAVKITYNQDSDNTKANCDQAVQEVHALSALSQSTDCPHIVKFFTGWKEEDKLFIQMELCQGSLDREGPLNGFESLSNDEILRVIKEVSLGL